MAWDRVTVPVLVPPLLNVALSVREFVHILSNGPVETLDHVLFVVLPTLVVYHVPVPPGVEFVPQNLSVAWPVFAKLPATRQAKNEARVFFIKMWMGIGW
jgi:hypothetical protein